MSEQQPNVQRIHARLVEVTEFSENVLANVERLLSQYTSNRSAFLKYTLCTIIESDASHLFFLYPETPPNGKPSDEVLGMVTINICQTCSFPRAWVDDFVVDNKHHHCGLAFTMMDQIIKFAHYLGAPRVMLTISDLRPEGLAFVRKFGFQEFNTNVFCYPIVQGNRGI